MLPIHHFFFVSACASAAILLSSCSRDNGGKEHGHQTPSAAASTAPSHPDATLHDASTSILTRTDGVNGRVLELPQTGAPEATAKRPVADYKTRLEKLEKIRQEVNVNLNPAIRPIQTLASQATIPGCSHSGQASFGHLRLDGGTNSVVTLFQCGGGQLLEVSESDTDVQTQNVVLMSLPEGSINARVNEHKAIYRHLVDESGRTSEIVSWLQPGRRVSVQAVSEDVPARALLERAVTELAQTSQRTAP